MQKREELQGRWALVTGASSGLGADFARQLSEHGMNLVLVARRQERLAQLKAEIEGSRSVRVHVAAMDLAERDSPQALYDQLRRDGIQVDVLVNNAGVGFFGRFIDLPWDKDRDTLALDIVSLVHMTKLFAKEMVSRGFGRILQIASTGAYQPDPSMATYGASKAFVLSFGEALAVELRGTGVTCTVLSPGYTATEFLDVSGQAPSRLKRLSTMTSRKVAAIGLRAMLGGRTSVVAGVTNALLAWSTRLLPRRCMAWMSQRVIEST